MGDDSAPTDAPRVFVSYAWSSQSHEDWVMAFATRLRGDGVDAMLDKWDLAHGQDSFAYMERIATDASVGRVLMICDRTYVERANARQGGVGVEARLISPLLYGSDASTQTRIAAACVERDATGAPYVPVFYKGRIHFDLTPEALFETEYGKVLRWAFSAPAHPRPPLGPRPVLLSNVPQHDAAPSSSPTDLQGAVQKAEDFRAHRLAAISAHRTPSPLAPGPVAVLHQVPLARETGELVDIVAIMKAGTHMPTPLAGRGGQVSVNLDGFANALDDGGYGQVFRSGGYEGTHVLRVHDGKAYIAGVAFPKMIVNAVRRTLALQADYGFSPPLAVMVSLCRARGACLRTPTEINVGYYESAAITAETVAIPHIVLRDAQADVPTALRPILNALWNAFGLAECGLYDGQGGWRGDT